MNITNIDDKILQAAAAQHTDPLDWARRLEQDFWRDMDALGVLRPHIVVRVTDHVDRHIVPMVNELMQHGFAYQREDGVYFSVDEYERRTGRRYQLFGQGLGQGDGYDATLSTQPRDFCLWKRQKAGEALVWQGPQNVPGRPGWHIECSAMIHAIQQSIQPLAFHLHVGGVDLQFPHHTNEIAQSEALTACCPREQQHSTDQPSHWIPHWMHTGHLHIDGLKMSKSLKNFISIQDYLLTSPTMENPWSSPADDFRWWCLQSSYRKPSTFTQVQIEQAREQRIKIVQCLVQAQELVSQRSASSQVCNPSVWSTRDRGLLWSAHETYESCLGALSNDLDGVTFCWELLQLVDKTSLCLQRQEHSVATETVLAADRTIRDLCALVGLSSVTCQAGLTEASKSDTSTLVVGGERALLEALIRFRADVRREAVSVLQKLSHDGDQTHHDATVGARNMLTLCDDMRNSTLKTLGVELLDTAADADNRTSPLWKPCLPMVREPKNCGSKRGEEQHIHPSNLGLEDLLAVPLDQYFRVGVYKGQFLDYDADGIPTANADGSVVSNRQRKRLLKKLEKHKKRLGGA